MKQINSTNKDELVVLLFGAAHFSYRTHTSTVQMCAQSRNVTFLEARFVCSEILEVVVADDDHNLVHAMD